MVFIPLTMTFPLGAIIGLVQKMGLTVMISWIFLMSTKIYRLADKNLSIEMVIS